MAISVDKNDGIIVVTVQNDLTNDTVGEFRQVMKSITEENKDEPLKIVMDFSQVNYLCSSALAVIGAVYKMSSSQSGALKMVNLQRRVERLFSMTKLTKMIQTFNDVESAKSSFSQ